MTPVTFSLPDAVSADEAKLFLALKLYEIGRLSCGQAAELAGYSKRTFLELMGKHGIATFDYSPAELASDLGHAGPTDRQQQ